MKEATTSVILWTKRMKKDGTYPVKLRLTYNRVQKFYSIDKYGSQTENDFETIKSSKSSRGDLKKAELHYSEMEKKAIAIINELPEFSFYLFEKKFNTTHLEEDNVFSQYSLYVDKLNQENRIKTAHSYKFSMVSLKKFYNKDKLEFKQVTPAFLTSYDEWMIKNGKSVTTIGFYLRNLRTIFNEAIQGGIIKQEYYPFGKRKYIIPAPRNIKKALTLEEIKKVYSYKPEELSMEERWWGLWIFSFLCNGINIKDVARLKYKNIHNETIEIIRAKTERTSRKNLKPITAHVLPKMKGIIDLLGNNNPKDDADVYVFPILEAGLTPMEESMKIDNTIRLINKYMTRIAKKVGVDKDITTYTARHSFATLLRNEGAPIEYIAEKFGHSDPKVTGNYLDSFPNELQKGWAEKMTTALNNI